MGDVVNYGRRKVRYSVLFCSLTGFVWLVSGIFKGNIKILVQLYFLFRESKKIKWETMNESINFLGTFTKL